MIASRLYQTALLIAFGLSACASTPKPASVLVEVPVSVPCSVAVTPRTFADATLPKDDDLAQWVGRLLAGRLQRDHYIAELEAANEGCRAP